MMSNHIDELKAKVAELQATIEAMEAEAAKPKNFEWNYVYGETYQVSEYKIYTHNAGNTNDYIEHGRYRLTKEVAEQSLLRNKRANRLEALAEQLGGLKEFVLGEYNYYIFFNCSAKGHIYTNDAYYKIHEVVYMTKECAIEICRMLNAGEFSLDGEL